MPVPRSLPYGMVISSNGSPFLVEFGANRVASLDPQTMAIREYPLPSADSHFPRGTFGPIIAAGVAVIAGERSRDAAVA